MNVEISPTVYLILCGLVNDALEVPSDAEPLLRRAVEELMSVTAGGMIPSELTEQPEHLLALRRVGMMGS